MRKGNATKRDVLPDPIYNSKLVTRLINKIMLDGKKGTSQKILYTAFKKIEEKTGKPDRRYRIGDRSFRRDGYGNIQIVY